MALALVAGMPRRRTPSAPRLTDLDPIDEESQGVVVVIETPKGSRTKLNYDPARDAFVVKKVLPEGMSFPFDFGFIPSTEGDDGDPLDVLLLMDEPLVPGAIVPSRLIGIIEATQEERDGEQMQNSRILAVSSVSLLFAEVRRLADLPETMVSQIEHFFVAYNEQAGKRFTPTGRGSYRRAESALESGRERYRRRRMS